MQGKIALLSAVFGVSAVLILALLGGATFPDYSHTSQFISELGARGAPHANFVNMAGFLPAGVLLILFSFVAWRLLPRSLWTSLGMLGIALFAFGYLVAAFFPCEAGCRPAEPTLSQAVHNTLGLLGYLTAPICLGALAHQALSWPRAGHLAVLGYVFAVTSFIGLVFLSPEFEYVGLAQRLLEVSVLSWVLVCALYVHRENGAPK